MQFIENRTFDELQVGDTAQLTHKLARRDIDMLSDLSDSVNPAHIDETLAGSDAFQDIVSRGMWGGALITTLIATELPGPGSRFLHQSLSYHRPVGIGDTITVSLEVTAKDPESRSVTLACACRNGHGDTVIEGEASVVAPEQKVRRPRVLHSEYNIRKPGAAYDELIASAHDLEPLVMAVVHPCDKLSLTGALEARSQGLITPLLVGPRAKIEAAADENGLSLEGVEIIDAPHSHASALRAVELVREGRAQSMMKGKLHTDEIMGAVVSREKGLRTDRRMSHVFVLDVPSYPKPLFITDAAINIAPDLSTKRDIVQNAIDLVQTLGVAIPKVAVLAAIETVDPAMPATVDAAGLYTMAARKQITGGIVEGPFAFDNAISKRAAETKGIASNIAGDVDILMVPDLESGNMLAKQLVYLAGAEAAGIVLGAQVPIVLTSRADGVLARLASAALAVLFVRRRQV